MSRAFHVHHNKRVLGSNQRFPSQFFLTMDPPPKKRAMETTELLAKFLQEQQKLMEKEQKLMEEEQKLWEERRKEREEQRKELQKLREEEQKLREERRKEREEQRNELQKLREEFSILKAHTMHQPSTTIYAQYYQQLKENNLLRSTPLSSSFFNGVRHVDTFTGIPSTGSEEKVVQPYWTNLILALNKESGVTVKFHDTSKKATINDYKPDILITTPGGTTTNSMNIVAVGELKGSENAQLLEKDKGQLDLYLQELLRLQPYRNMVYGFLTNNKCLLLVKAKRVEQNIEFCEICEQTFDGGTAWKCLDYLATSSLENLHFWNPVNEEIHEIKFLGYGHFSAVYSGMYQGEKVVVKTNSFAEKLSVEKNTLEILKGVQNVPKFVAELENVLLVKPVANKFSLETLRPQHIEQLVEALRQAHFRGIVHRDVRPPNIFVTDDKTALLIDWGSACPVGSSPVFEGAILEASDNILDALIAEQYCPEARPVDDLHALARSIYSITRRASLPLISNPPTKPQLKDVKEYWMKTVSHWRRIFEKADNTTDFRNKSTYDEFAKELSDHL